MIDALKLSIRERQRMELSGVLNCLHNPKRDDVNSDIGSIYPIPNKTVIKKHAKAIIERLNSENLDNENLDDIEVMPSESSTKQQSDNRTCIENLPEEIEKSMLTVEPETQK